jgi:hypothetical protein
MIYVPLRAVDTLISLLPGERQSSALLVPVGGTAGVSVPTDGHWLLGDRRGHLG